MFRADLKVEKDIATVVLFGNAGEIKPGIIPEVRKALDSNIRDDAGLDLTGIAE